LAKRNKFEDNPDVTVRASIQKGHRSGGPLLRIFDNKVERASRESRSGLAWSFSQGK